MMKHWELLQAHQCILELQRLVFAQLLGLA
jgi:hypothetical protein